jgi:very-short-patch-repair endonuclease
MEASNQDFCGRAKKEGSETSTLWHGVALPSPGMEWVVGILKDSNLEARMIKLVMGFISSNFVKDYFMTYFQRGLLATVLILLGVVFWPFLAVGGLIAWSVYSDIREAPERKIQEAEIEACLKEPIAVEDMRLTCESPAEEAFFDAMVTSYGMAAGPGCIAGKGIELRTQIGLGQLRIGNGTAWRQFRGDFLVDDKLVVEVDGATWHGTTEAMVRDAKRDKVIDADGYTVLRVPANVVFNEPMEAVRQVEEARRQLRVA